MYTSIENGKTRVQRFSTSLGLPIIRTLRKLERCRILKVIFVIYSRCEQTDIWNKVNSSDWKTYILNSLDNYKFELSSLREITN